MKDSIEPKWPSKINKGLAYIADQDIIGIHGSKPTQDYAEHLARKQRTDIWYNIQQVVEARGT